MRKTPIFVSGIALLTLTSMSAYAQKNGPAAQSPNNSAPRANDRNVVIGADVSSDPVKQWVPFTSRINFTDRDGDRLSYSVAMNGQGGDAAPGAVSINESTGEFSYVAYTQDPASFTVTASDGQSSTAVVVNVENVQGDPYTVEQWHLRNTGQYAFAQTDEALEGYRDYLVDRGSISPNQRESVMYPEGASVAGVDMNIFPVERANITGDGVIVAVVDSGLEIRHEDLQANVKPGASLNFVDGAADPSDPTNTDTNTGDHGTSVAGLIAAEAWNGVGGRGVAPNAELVGMNYIRSQTLTAEMLSHGMPGPRQTLTTADNVSSFNRSYGVSAPYFIAADDVDLAIQSYPALNMRDGKGTLDTKANGNAWEGIGSTNICDAVDPNQFGLGCLDANMDPENASPYNVSVAAIRADGRRSSYSSDGANTFISAPAGEYGFRDPAVLTTDQSSCQQGYASFPSARNLDAAVGYNGYTAALYPFNAPSVDAYNPDCNYTNRFNGTSAATPNTAGVIALMIEANPDLTWRQIKQILAGTARQIDANDAPVVLNVGGGQWTASQGWVRNAAGYTFNRKYGFGLVDAEAAVDEAQNNAPVIGPLVDTDWIDANLGRSASIPDNDAAGVTRTIMVDNDVQIEALQLRFTVSNREMRKVYQRTDRRGRFHASTAGIDLGIEVTSPSGTRAVLLSGKQALLIPSTNSSDSTQIMLNTPLLANAFYGESSAGQWQVKLVDTSNRGYSLNDGGQIFSRAPLIVENNTVDSTLDDFGIRVIGH